MTVLDKSDSRYKSLVNYLHDHIENMPYSKLKSVLLKKGWPKDWIDLAHTDLLDEIHETKPSKIKKRNKKKVSSKSQSKLLKKDSTTKDEVKVPEDYKSKLLSKLGGLKKKSVSSDSKKPKGLTSRMKSYDYSQKLMENDFKTHEYLQKLLARKEKSKHFYERENLNSERSGASNKDFDVLREAIKLAQEVIKSPRAVAPMPQTVSSPAAPAPQPVASSNPPAKGVFPGGTEINKVDLDKEFEEQKKQLEAEKEQLRRDKERLMDDQRKAMEEQAKALNLRVNSVNITSENKPEESKRSRRKSSSDFDNNILESKMQLLEEKLKNIDYSQGFKKDTTFKNEIVPEEVEFVSEPVGDRAQTGISGLDPIIQGGFRRLTANMVAGGPGSGKTMFAMQYLVNGIESFEEHGLYITFEQTKRDLYSLFKDVGVDLEKLEKDKKLTIIRMSPQQLAKMLESGGGSLRDVIDSIHASRIVIDSVSDYLMLFDGDMDKRRACIDMFDFFAKMKCTSLVVSEQEVSPLKHVSSVLEYQVDGVILLYNERVGDIRQRAVEIFKMRGTKHAGRIFPMKITDVGVMILSNHPLNPQ